MPLIETLRRQGKGVLLSYSVEYDENAVSGGLGSGETVGYKRNVLEVMRSVDVAGDFEDRAGKDTGRTSWVALKLVIFFPRDCLIKLLSLIYLF